MEETEDKPADVESTDSEATIFYTPPILPDATETPIEKKGKLQIMKLSLRKVAPPKKTRMFRCAKCVLTFNLISDLNEHFIDKHCKLESQDCKNSFSKPRSYTKHKSQHKQSKQ